jgi:hypothetical protein
MGACMFVTVQVCAMLQQYASVRQCTCVLLLTSHPGDSNISAFTADTHAMVFSMLPWVFLGLDEAE